MKNLKELLKAIGLKKNDVAVYTHILINGPASVTEISRDLKIQRPLVYKALDALGGKRLCLTELKDGRKLHKVSEPEALKEIVKNISVSLEDTLPEIETAYARHNTGTSIKILKGASGITQVFADSINSSNKGDTFYRYTSEKDLDKVNQYLPRDYREKRDAKKLERLVISNFTSGLKKKSRLERFIKFIPKEFNQFEQNIIELIYSDKVALIDLSSETSLIVTNKALADFQKTIFKLLYKKL